MQMHQCARCNVILPPSSAICQQCLSREIKAIDMPGRGVLASWTTIRRAPAGYPVAAPYEVVVVDIAPGVRVTGRLATESRPPSMGAHVEQVAEEGACPVFAVCAG